MGNSRKDEEKTDIQSWSWVETRKKIVRRRAMRSAALENHECVVLLDKSYFCDGNTTKSTNGINGAKTMIQCEENIKEEEIEFAKVLREMNGVDVEWLMDAFTFDLSLFARRTRGSSRVRLELRTELPSVLSKASQSRTLAL